MPPAFPGGGGAGGGQVRKLEFQTKFTADASQANAAMRDMAAQADKLAANVSAAQKALSGFGAGMTQPKQQPVAAQQSWWGSAGKALNAKTDFLAGAGTAFAAVETLRGVGELGLQVSRLGMEARSARSELLELQRAIPFIGDATASLNNLIFSISDRFRDGGVVRDVANRRFTTEADLANVRNRGVQAAFRQRGSLAEEDAYLRSAAYASRAGLARAGGLGVDGIPSGTGLAYDIAARSAALGDSSAQVALADAERGVGLARTEVGLTGRAAAAARAVRDRNEQIAAAARARFSNADSAAANAANALIGQYSRGRVAGPPVSGGDLTGGGGENFYDLSRGRNPDGGESFRASFARAQQAALEAQQALARSAAVQQVSEASIAESKERQLAHDRAKAELAAREFDLSKARLDLVRQEEQKVRGGARSFGSMDPASQQQLLFAARQAQQFGFENLPPVARQVLLGNGITGDHFGKIAEDLGAAAAGFKELMQAVGQKDLMALQDERKKLEAEVRVTATVNEAQFKDLVRKSLAEEFGPGLNTLIRKAILEEAGIQLRQAAAATAAERQ